MGRLGGESIARNVYAEFSKMAGGNVTWTNLNCEFVRKTNLFSLTYVLSLWDSIQRRSSKLSNFCVH